VHLLPASSVARSVARNSPAPRFSFRQTIRAFANAKIDIKLVLTGEAKLEKNIRAQVEKLGLRERAIFIGFKKNPYPYIKQAKALVLTSDFEGLPTVILEAISLDAPL